MKKPGSQNNAFKHGAFSDFMILPGDNAEEFKQLHQSLVLEWAPAGALEEDVVLTLAQTIMQKRRVDRYYHQEMIWAEQHPDEEVLNDVDSMYRLLDNLKTFGAVADLVSNLPKEFRDWINKEHPQSQFKDAESLACTRFRRHQVRCFNGTGGASWSGGSLRGSSSLRPYG